MVSEKSATIGRKIRNYRLESNLTLADVADRTGLSVPYISNLENGRGNPTLETLTSLAEAVDSTMAELFGSVDVPEVKECTVCGGDAAKGDVCRRCRTEGHKPCPAKCGRSISPDSRFRCCRPCLKQLARRALTDEWQDVFELSGRKPTWWLRELALSLVGKGWTVEVFEWSLFDPAVHFFHPQLGRFAVLGRTKMRVTSMADVLSCRQETVRTLWLPADMPTKMLPGLALDLLRWTPQGGDVR